MDLIYDPNYDQLCQMFHMSLERLCVQALTGCKVQYMSTRSSFLVLFFISLASSLNFYLLSIEAKILDFSKVRIFISDGLTILSLGNTFSEVMLLVLKYILILVQLYHLSTVQSFACYIYISFYFQPLCNLYPFVSCKQQHVTEIFRMLLNQSFNWKYLDILNGNCLTGNIWVY